MMTNTHSLPGRCLLLSLGLSLTGLTQAYSAGDMLLRFGTATVAPDTSTGALYVDGDKIGGKDLVDVESATAMGLSFTYMVTPLFGIELLVASPFEHDIEFDSGEDLGSVQHLPPTLSAQYYPLGESSQTWQPYAGIGLNYTVFFDEQLSSETKEELELSNSDFSLDDSLGLALTLGVDWLFSDHWFANVAVMWVDLETDAQIDGSIDSTPVRLEIKDIEIDPWVYRVNLGYRF